MSERIIERTEQRIDNNPDKITTSKIANKMKNNPWIISTIILGFIILVLLIVMIGKIRITGNVVSENDATQNLIDFAKNQGIELIVDNVSDEGSFYAVSFLINGQDSGAYITKDGEYLITPVAQLTGKAIDNTNTNTETPAEVPKSNKPIVEAYIFSYCPYGLQFEKALLPVYNLLKNKADINIVAIGAMHGEFEKTESLRQISIKQLYGKDKLFAYLKEFDESSDIGSCSGDVVCLDKYLPLIYTKLGIDKNKVNQYIDTNAEKIYEEQNAKASSLGISGSPTFVINGVQVSVDRTPDAIKTAVCNAFNTAPAECSQTLSSASPSPGFGGSTTAGASTGVQCST